MAAIGLGLLLLGVLRLGRGISLSEELMRYAPNGLTPTLDGEDTVDERIRRLELQLGLPRGLGAASHSGARPPALSVIAPPPPPMLSNAGASSAVAPKPFSATRSKAWDNSQLLAAGDVLQRVPRGKLVFVSLANSAYADLAVNWALVSFVFL